VYISSSANAIFSWNLIMSPVEAEIAYRAAQRALKNYQLGRDVLDRVVLALPPPPAGAPVAWRHARLRQIIQEILAFSPADPLEAMMASQIVVSRHHAADTARQCLDGALSTRLALQMRRTSDALLRAAIQTERTLTKWRQGRGAGSPVPAAVQFDLEALDAIWCRTAPRVDPPGSSPAQIAATAGSACVPSPAPLPDTRQAASVPAPVQTPKFTLCGQRIDLVRLETMPPAGTA
jgi:hypothetical protein